MPGIPEQDFLCPALSYGDTEIYQIDIPKYALAFCIVIY